MTTLSYITILDRSFANTLDRDGRTITRHQTATGITMEVDSRFGDGTYDAVVSAGRIIGHGHGPSAEIALQNAIDDYNVQYSRHMAYGSL